MRIGEYKNLPVMEFKTPHKWENWLSKNYHRDDGVWFRFFKKSSGKSGVNYAQALDVALCYGWIDGQVKSYDAESWLQKYTPRRSRSPWSKINTGHAQRLIKEDRMKPAGLKQIELAKADGRWANAYDSGSKAKMPTDFLRQLGKNKKAKVFFETLNKTNKYAIFYMLKNAKRPETRERRMKKFLGMMAKGQKLY
jgi:uncharacterized protein YdeI (YjbR/CyaY-like superfamily)